MSKVVHAIYEQGVFRPIVAVDLPERTHVEFEPRVLGEVPSSASFWKSESLDELAVRQGIAPVSDLEEISSLWPADDHPDELIEHIQNEREARRSLSRENRAP